jgi:hypothetical protein
MEIHFTLTDEAMRTLEKVRTIPARVLPAIAAAIMKAMETP